MVKITIDGTGEIGNGDGVTVEIEGSKKTVEWARKRFPGATIITPAGAAADTSSAATGEEQGSKRVGWRQKLTEWNNAIGDLVAGVVVDQMGGPIFRGEDRRGETPDIPEVKAPSPPRSPERKASRFPGFGGTTIEVSSGGHEVSGRTVEEVMEKLRRAERQATGNESRTDVPPEAGTPGGPAAPAATATDARAQGKQGKGRE